MRKYKIGIVVDQLLAGGVQLAAIEQVKELIKLGHTAKLLILMRKKYSTDFSYLVKEIPYQYLSDSYPIFLRKTIKLPIFSFLSTLHLLSPFLATSVIKKDEYDVLISLGTTTCLTTQAIYKRNFIPYIAVIHDPIEYILKKAYSKTFLRFLYPFIIPIAKRFEKSFVHDAKKTIIISKVHQKYLMQNYNVKPLVHTFGAKTIAKLPRKRGDQLLSFGRWQSKKNPYFLLDIAEKLPQTKLIIAGSWIDPKEFVEMETAIRKRGLLRQVKLIPYYDEKLLKKLCKNARLFVHPHFEAFGLAALEAAGHGLPIIIPQKSGVTENFKHSIHGFFPSKLITSEYLFYINKLISNETLARKMGENAWQIVKDKLSWKANTEQLLNTINNVLLQKPTMYIVEIGHTFSTSLAGGDKLMEPMAIRLSKRYLFSVIVSSVGAKHWKIAKVKKQLYILKRNYFDKGATPFKIFLTYCMRMHQAFTILKEKLSSNPQTITNQTILYSSTNILPDVLPVYFIKKIYPMTKWIARVHHLIPPPHKREGNSIVNTASYIMQYIALYMMKKEADLTIALNSKLKNDLEKNGFSTQKLKVLGGGIEFRKINKVKTENIDLTFNAVFLGRLHVTKGVFDTIPIWQEVVKTNPNARLAIIGDGPYYIKKELQDRIKKAHLSQNIRLLGFLPYRTVYSIMKRADLFLFLDHEAGWGLAVAEAMACGLPVVGYNNGILGSVYKNGFLKSTIGNYHTISEHVGKLMNNKSLRNELAAKAIQEAAKHDWKMTSNKFSNLLQKNVLQYE